VWGNTSHSPTPRATALVCPSPSRVIGMHRSRSERDPNHDPLGARRGGPFVRATCSVGKRAIPHLDARRRNGNFSAVRDVVQCVTGKPSARLGAVREGERRGLRLREEPGRLPNRFKTPQRTSTRTHRLSAIAAALPPGRFARGRVSFVEVAFDRRFSDAEPEFTCSCTATSMGRYGFRTGRTDWPSRASISAATLFQLPCCDADSRRRRNVARRRRGHLDARFGADNHTESLGPSVTPLRARGFAPERLGWDGCVATRL
jgi:hypothetical protein